MTSKGNRIVTDVTSNPHVTSWCSNVIIFKVWWGDLWESLRFFQGFYEVNVILIIILMYHLLFFTLILSQVYVFHKLHDRWYLNILNAEAYMQIQLSSFYTRHLKYWKNLKQCHFFTRHFVFENMVIFHSIYYLYKSIMEYLFSMN